MPASPQHQRGWLQVLANPETDRVAARSEPVDAESDARHARDTLEHVMLATRDEFRAERKDRKLIDRAKGLKLAEVALRMPDVVATRLPG